MKKTSRYERLGRMLLKYYGFNIRRLGPGYIYKYECKPRGPGIYWDDPCVYLFSSWKKLLFSCIHSTSLNDHIREFVYESTWKSFKKFESRIIDFESCDELEVKLALMGCL